MNNRNLPLEMIKWQILIYYFFLQNILVFIMM